jgi:hypothetical protein
MVNETNQPYLYAGDDPVNGVDPLGLHGCGWTDPWGCVANGVDQLNSALNSANNWLANSVNTAVCEDLPGTNRGSLAGWMQRQAGCGSGNSTNAASSSQSNSNCWPSSSSVEGIGGTLRFLHPESRLRDSPSYEYWSQQPTDDILKSLAPGDPDGLLVNESGGILDGNTRTLVLEDRGYDINTLPREIQQPIGGIPDLPEPPIEGL